MKDEGKSIHGSKAGKGDLEKLARLVRYFILISTTGAGSGHPTSSLSAADLLVGPYVYRIIQIRCGKPETSLQ